MTVILWLFIFTLISWKWCLCE